MEGGSFVITVSDMNEDNLRRHGLDKIGYLVAANAGQTPQPLNKVASGGELSRIALALQVCVMEATTAPTLIFDEIDVGIGGRVAEIVGQQLAKLGAVRQVLCITHLAQVAVCADQQIQVQKSADSGLSRVQTTLLDEAERIDEIARMLGGRISDQSRAHATELLATAHMRH